MDYSKNRCPICLSHFCCVEHKNAHINKNHPEYLKKQSQEYLLRIFQKKAKQVIYNAQKHKTYRKKPEDRPTKTEKDNNSKDTNANKNRLPIKRLHSERNQQIVSTAVIIKSETRKVLVPAHRLQKKFPNCQILEAKACVKMKESSPCDATVVKTSTPIIKDHLDEGTSQDSWNISQVSSISRYQTPPVQRLTISVYETLPNVEGNAGLEEPISCKSQFQQGKRTIISPRSILSKVSKYDTDLGPSPILSIPKARRVTFSFGSTNSILVESVNDVAVCKEIQDDCVFEFNTNLKNDDKASHLVGNCVEEITFFPEKYYPEDNGRTVSTRHSRVANSRPVDSSPTDNIKSGFFNCVTNMICSAVPIFMSWREFYNGEGNRSKRSRSPDRKCVSNDVVRSPESKRLCYPCDLRLNPIKARKPISQSSS